MIGFQTIKVLLFAIIPGILLNTGPVAGCCNTTTLDACMAPIGNMNLSMIYLQSTNDNALAKICGTLSNATTCMTNNTECTTCDPHYQSYWAGYVDALTYICNEGMTEFFNYQTCLTIPNFVDGLDGCLGIMPVTTMGPSTTTTTAASTSTATTTPPASTSTTVSTSTASTTSATSTTPGSTTTAPSTTTSPPPTTTMPLTNSSCMKAQSELTCLDQTVQNSTCQYKDVVANYYMKFNQPQLNSGNNKCPLARPPPPLPPTTQAPPAICGSIQNGGSISVLVLISGVMFRLLG